MVARRWRLTMLTPALLMALVSDPALARARLDTSGHLKLFSISTFPVPFDGDELPGQALAASGSAVADSRLKLLWRPSRRVRIELHPTATINQGDSFGGLSTGVSRSGSELLPLTWDVVNDDQLGLKLRLDRASLRWDIKRLRMTVGRQPVSFGKGRLFTPLDLVTPFSPTTLDNSFKPGVDALRGELFQGQTGVHTLVAAYTAEAGDRFDDWTMKHAVLAAHSKGSIGDTVELEGFLGLLRDEPVLGLSLFYNGGSVGVYGDLNLTAAEDETFGRAVLGLQYKPSGESFLTAELYGQTIGSQEPTEYLVVAQSERVRRGEQGQLGQAYGALMGSYQLRPLIALAGALIVNLTDPSALIMPSMNWSAADNASVSVGLLAGLGERPVVSIGAFGRPSITPSSEYGMVPVSAFISGSFFF